MLSKSKKSCHNKTGQLQFVGARYSYNGLATILLFTRPQAKRPRATQPRATRPRATRPQATRPHSNQEQLRTYHSILTFKIQKQTEVAEA